MPPANAPQMCGQVATPILMKEDGAARLQLHLVAAHDACCTLRIMHNCTLRIVCSHRVMKRCLVRESSTIPAADLGAAMALAWPHDNERWRRRSGWNCKRCSATDRYERK
jgi:hypothetical protein